MRPDQGKVTELALAADVMVDLGKAFRHPGNTPYGPTGLRYLLHRESGTWLVECFGQPEIVPASLVRAAAGQVLGLLDKGYGDVDIVVSKGSWSAEVELYLELREDAEEIGMGLSEDYGDIYVTGDLPVTRLREVAELLLAATAAS